MSGEGECVFNTERVDQKLVSNLDGLQILEEENKLELQRFILIVCSERDISILGIFKKHADAYEAMKKDFINSTGLNEEEISEENCSTSEWELNSNDAWSNIDDSLDWLISKETIVCTPEELEQTFRKKEEQ